MNKESTTPTSRRKPIDATAPNLAGPIADYKDVELLRKFMTSSSKIMSRRRAGTNTQEQKTVKLAIKRARFLALVPYRGA